MKNQIITHQIPEEKLKQLGLLNCCHGFKKLLERVVLGELQVPNVLHYRFKNFQRYNSNKS